MTEHIHQPPADMTKLHRRVKAWTWALLGNLYLVMGFFQGIVPPPGTPDTPRTHLVTVVCKVITYGGMGMMVITFIGLTLAMRQRDRALPADPVQAGDEPS